MATEDDIAELNAKRKLLVNSELAATEASIAYFEKRLAFWKSDAKERGDEISSRMVQHMTEILEISRVRREQLRKEIAHDCGFSIPAPFEN